MEVLVLNALANGLMLGVIYSLVGASLSLIYGVMQVKNFAHGEFIVAGAYVAYLLARVGSGVHPLVAAPVAFVAAGLFGLVLHQILMPRLQKAEDPMSTSLLAMFGLSLVLSAGMLLVFEADPRTLDFQFRPLFIRLGPVALPTSRLVACALSVVIAGLLALFLYRTLTGKALRAAMMNRDAVQIVGIDVDRLSAGAFALSIGLAGATGVLLAMVFPVFTPFSGVDYTLIGFIVVVLGGLGSPIGAIAGGIVFGLAEQLASVFLPQILAPAVGFAMMVATIMLRPSGLLGAARAA